MYGYRPPKKHLNGDEEQFARALLANLREAGVTKEVLVKTVGVSETAAREWLAGKTAPTRGNLMRLKRAYPTFVSAILVPNTGTDSSASVR